MSLSSTLNSFGRTKFVIRLNPKLIKFAIRTYISPFFSDVDIIDFLFLYFYEDRMLSIFNFTLYRIKHDSKFYFFKCSLGCFLFIIWEHQNLQFIFQIFFVFCKSYKSFFCFFWHHLGIPF